MAERRDDDRPAGASRGVAGGRVDAGDAATWPTVIATSVIRSAHQGQSHGGVFLIDLATGDHLQVIDWDDGAIDWEGRGGDRGLRGIAFHAGRVFLAASDEIFVFDQRFRRIASITSPYLKHCHEICVHGDRLYLTSTGYDAMLVFDLANWRFVEGICLRPLEFTGRRFASYRYRKALARRLARLHPAFYRLFTGQLGAWRFDPAGGAGPTRCDMLHINSVTAGEDGIDVAGIELDGLFRLAGRGVERVAAVPRGTHNARLAEGDLVYHHTAGDRLALVPGARGRAEEFVLPRYAADELQNAHLRQDHARQAFGRGLCLAGDLLIAGSSPATISVFRRGMPRPLRSIGLSRDLRNAIHGLEVWPFDRRLADWRERTAGERAPVMRAAVSAGTADGRQRHPAPVPCAP